MIQAGILLFILLLQSSLAAYAAKQSFLELSFLFDWNPPGTDVPIPISVQCERLHITWDRRTATGPSPTAPYYLQIYTSTSITPFLVEAGDQLSFDFDVPFAPNTQIVSNLHGVFGVALESLYSWTFSQFDKFGFTGGCQDIYTVIANTTSTGPLTCNNVTSTMGMDVNARDSIGPLSRYGFIDQCTDISVTPVNATPPFTFTIAPALHPPLNITSDTLDAINWTVSLSWASPFFISLVDSQGRMWSQGPLHSGSGQTGCLDLDRVPTTRVPRGVALGTGIGGSVLGMVLGIASYVLFHRLRARRRWRQRLSDADLITPSNPLDDRPYGTFASDTHNSLDASSHGHGTDLSHHIEPFTLSVPPPSNSHITAPGSPPLPPLPDLSGQTGPNATRKPGQIYVVHHDGGHAPVTVYTDNGAQVVELPPSYTDNRHGRPDPDQSRRATLKR